MEKREDLHGEHGERWVNRLRVGVSDLDSFAADSSLGHSCAGRSPLGPKTRSHTENTESSEFGEERRFHGVHGEHWVNGLRVGVSDLDSFAAD